jgi:hypothetical protein
MSTPQTPPPAAFLKRCRQRHFTKRRRQRHFSNILISILSLAH